MTKERSSSHTRRPIDTSLSNSYSSGVSSLSSSNYGVRTIRVFKNGDPYHQGTKFVVNRRYVSDLDHLLNILSDKIDLPYGAKRLFTTNGKLIRHLNDIEDKQDYVASSNHYIPLKYGNTTTSGHPFRSTSPINIPQSRQSRSQTRNELKPTVMKRSQSGLTSASTTSERNVRSKTKSTQETPTKKNAEGKPKKKVVKKKKKTTSEVIIPVADTKKEEEKEPEVEVKEEQKEEENKKDENEEIVIPQAKEDTPRTIERSPSPKKDGHASGDEHKEEKSRTPSPSAHSATEHEDHSANEKHSDGNESDVEKSPMPERKETPKSNGKEQHKSGESGSDKESDDQH